MLGAERLQDVRRTGCLALAQRRSTLPGVVIAASVVRSYGGDGPQEPAACHTCLTLRRAVIVAARRSTAARLTRVSLTQPRSNGTPDAPESLVERGNIDVDHGHRCSLPFGDGSG